MCQWLCPMRRNTAAAIATPTIRNTNDLRSWFFLWNASGSMSQSATYMNVPAENARGSPTMPSTDTPLRIRNEIIAPMGVIILNDTRYFIIVLLSSSDSRKVDDRENRTTNLWMHIPPSAVAIGGGVILLLMGVRMVFSSFGGAPRNDAPLPPLPAEPAPLAPPEDFCEALFNPGKLFAALRCWKQTIWLNLMMS